MPSSGTVLVILLMYYLNVLLLYLKNKKYPLYIAKNKHVNNFKDIGQYFEYTILSELSTKSSPLVSKHQHGLFRNNFRKISNGLPN